MSRIFCPILVLATLPLLVGAVDAAAQASPLIVEFRGGAAVPAFSFSDGDRPGEGVGVGPSFGVELALARGPRKSLTVGFSQHRFTCEELGCGSSEDFVATGMNVGMRVNLRTNGEMIPWVRLGGRSVRVELPERDGTPAGTSDLGYGGEVGAGVYIGTFGAVGFDPGIRFTATNTELPSGDLLRLRHWVADLALVLAF